MMSNACSYHVHHQYVVFSQSWVYVDDPILGRVCAIAGANVSINTLLKYVLYIVFVANTELISDLPVVRKSALSDGIF